MATWGLWSVEFRAERWKRWSHGREGRESARRSSTVTLEAVAGVAFAVGTAGNAIKHVPQFLRTAVRGHVAGLAVTAVWLAGTAQVLWLAFGFAIRDWRFVALGIGQTVLAAGTLSRFVAKTGWARNRWHAAVALPLWAAFALASSSGGALALESLGATLGIVIGAPQLLYLWRRRRAATDVSGVSQAEYVVVITAQIAWTCYWLTQGHPVAAAGAAWGGTARVATFGLLRSQHRRARVSFTAMDQAIASRPGLGT